MGSHPVAVVQYTYRHKQYRKRHKTNNTKNIKIHRATQQLGRVHRLRPGSTSIFVTGTTAKISTNENTSEASINH
jgi:thiamine phosphate synthase YjbQ (UPF0047 family)